MLELLYWFKVSSFLKKIQDLLPHRAQKLILCEVQDQIEHQKNIIEFLCFECLIQSGENDNFSELSSYEVRFNLFGLRLTQGQIEPTK